MNARNKLIIGLIIVIIAFVGIAQGIIMPRIAQEEQSTAKPLDPLTHDFSSILKYKNKYMGNASNLGNLFHSLPLNDIGMSFQMFPDTLAADINYKANASDIDEYKLNRALIYNSTAAFVLIDNLEAVRFNFEEASYKILRSDVEKWYGTSLRTLAGKGIWEEKVQSKLRDDKYVHNCIKSIETVAKERTPIAEAIVEFYDNTTEPIIIYEQVPFESGTLVLAEKLRDGEHYPDLHFVDANNKVTYHTLGSYCWTLNYTQFKGHYIYFGLAGAETRQNRDKQIPVEKVEALFSDKTVSVRVREKKIEHINYIENDTRQFRNSHGYIIPVKSRDIPEDFTAILENAENMSLSKRVIKNNLEYMPEYLKSKNTEVYNSFAFTFTPMLTPAEWDKSYKEGEICLKGKTDKNGNLNALYLRPAGHMSYADSFILPQDIKPLYLSYNYPRMASFSAGETVSVKYPEKRKFVDCHILRLTREKVEKEIGQDSFIMIRTDEKGLTILPEEQGYYLFLLRTEEDKEIQTYTGMFIIN